MKLASFEAIASVLNRADVRYLVAGGLAVNAHGYLRFTADVDIVLALDQNNIINAIEALATIGYRPSVPVRALDFADTRMRGQWIDEKGMVVFNLFSDQHPDTSIDIFADEPFDFNKAYTATSPSEIGPGLHVRFVTLETLIQMKEQSGRPKDQDDVLHLKQILQARDSDE